MNDIENKIEISKKYGRYLIDKLAFQNKMHLRIIDENIEFPKNYEWVKWSDTIEVEKQSWVKAKGWGKPDLEFDGVEIRYLWKEFEPLSFNEWVKTIQYE